MMSRSIRVGLISDTHGLLRPEATAFLSGCHLILHGGDIGGPVSRSSALSRSQQAFASWCPATRISPRSNNAAASCSSIPAVPDRAASSCPSPPELMVSESAVAARIVDLLSGQILAESKFSFRS
jgi:hypothetical protein